MVNYFRRGLARSGALVGQERALPEVLHERAGRAGLFQAVRDQVGLKERLFRWLKRLYYLADRVVEITTEMFKQPRRMVQEISGLGLRHVGFGIPTEMFGPYVSAAVDTVAAIAEDENALQGFRWSLTLVAKILVRAVGEGATLVMRAINTNQEVAMRKALAIAPRGRRAMEMLNISAPRHLKGGARTPAGCMH